MWDDWLGVLCGGGGVCVWDDWLGLLCGGGVCGMTGLVYCVVVCVCV